LLQITSVKDLVLGAHLIICFLKEKKNVKQILRPIKMQRGLSQVGWHSFLVSFKSIAKKAKKDSYLKCRKFGQEIQVLLLVYCMDRRESTFFSITVYIRRRTHSNTIEKRSLNVFSDAKTRKAFKKKDHIENTE